MERNLLLIALPRAAMCMQFPAQGVGEGGSNVLRRNQKQLGAGIWLLLHSTPPLPPGAHTSAQGIECREPSPACQSQGAARGAPRVTAGSGLCAWAPCQAELLPGGALAGSQLRVRGVFTGICHHLQKRLFFSSLPL